MKAKITVNGKTYVSDSIVYSNGIVSIDGIIQNGYADIPLTDVNVEKNKLKLNLALAILNFLAKICTIIWMIWITVLVSAK